ncbi:hypothetical protein GBAR_LOCUS1161 [Geodia barretti]|uniref:Secreted protein n=1 Tax=Geodia barretti TaxID=519541 RepID=A0AA35VUL2_GEOBA|nr:hypothetical protein GBAR_LOCUS1161 [Geodia barretti]
MASSVLTVACILLLMSTFAECQNLSCYDVGDTNTELGRCNVQLGRGECKGSCNSLLMNANLLERTIRRLLILTALVPVEPERW